MDDIKKGVLDERLPSSEQTSARGLRNHMYNPWEEWHQLWIASGAKGNDVWRIFDGLAKLYSQPWRRYHTLAYVVRCLRELTRSGTRGLAEDPLAIEYAIWFLNVAYCHGDSVEPRGNKDTNACDAWWVIKGALSEERANKICDLIRATDREDLDVVGQDAKLLLDINLADLGRPPAIFDHYEEARLEELLPAGLRDSDAHRRAIYSERREQLIALLNRRNIYHTEFFRDLYEKQARENLKRAVADPSPIPAAP